MQRLSSYVQGAWVEGSGTPVEIHDPTNEEPIAACDSTGIDFAAVVEHARALGSPGLRALSFPARGQLLKRLSTALHGRREELIEVARRNGGSTRGDAKFDIDGATSTLAAYAYFARDLGERAHLVDGGPMPLGRTPRFSGQHVWVPRTGVAVHINAFNFPSWGMLEKMACALLAGVAVIEKPGTSTALLAWEVARTIVESEVLPEGSFQFLCGGVGDLLEHLGAQDCLAFTGSAATGAKLKGNANLVRSNARVNIEADSLNAAVLAPDVDDESETYGLFLANVALDMTQKTGQKCTAVRRILVPAERVEAVTADLVAELGRVRVGDPGERETRMGPLSSRAQFEDVRAGIGRLAEVAGIACGGTAPLRERGWFVAPTLLVARDREAEILHDEEVFGPVATILPYSGSAGEAVELVSRGGGGLVVSVYSNDADWTESVVRGLAPWHGRIWIGSDRTAGQSLPPGIVLPGMVHGGPGRAGGGEELGALRGLEFYMQRTALQGYLGLLESRFGPPAPEAAAAGSGSE
ncbi:MAG: aldehyde dehydrogenase [Planctomycetes bacterium]|jgi:oxepin-CoA hydrolase/3-oxo-5,6-dehydrosuberyl-CoA semialdehyde dehydrogenase|nr:aldehyde dehydrogenase [Planctomycetota bacterium]MDP6409420.1 3,4-dehydroadipyl-CoA semialdehyde dehydrogenase [Planctomycetota bacterium]